MTTLTARLVDWDSPAEKLEILHFQVLDGAGRLVREEWEVRCDRSPCSDPAVTGIATAAAATSTAAEHRCTAGQAHR